MIALHQFTDSELLALLKQGQHTAFTELYNRHWKSLLLSAYHHTRDKSLAEEVLQEIFISIWKRRELIEIQSFEAYMATAIKFSVFKHYHREYKRKRIAQAQYEQTPCLDDQEIEARFVQEYIDGLVEKLPEKCRLVFIYSRTKGKSIPEIAREMNIAEKTVEAHLTKGLKYIKSHLQQSGVMHLLCLFL